MYFGKREINSKFDTWKKLQKSLKKTLDAFQEKVFDNGDVKFVNSVMRNVSTSQIFYNLTLRQRFPFCGQQTDFSLICHQD